MSYATDGFRPHRIFFADIPALGRAGPKGSALGGAGIAVSARSSFRREAADFAYFAASGEVQAGLYAVSGGQPAHARAWELEAVNAPAAGFYRATRRTLDGAFLRPRHAGYMAFQDEAARLINGALRTRASASATIAAINARFQASLAAATE